MDTVFQIFAVLAMSSIIIGPWIHAWKLGRVERRLDEIEQRIADLEFGGNDYDPEPEKESALFGENIIAFGKRAA